MSRRTVNNWKPIKGQPLTELDKKILYIQNKGHLVPTRKLIKTPEPVSYTHLTLPTSDLV